VRSLGVPEERVHLIRPAVDLERFTPRSGTRRADDDLGPLVVSVGRLHWVKDQATLLRAFADLRRRHSAARLVLVGDGPEREALVFLVDQLGLVDAVELTGSVPPDRVRELLDTAAVAVCSSRSEGTSNAVLEAMALGIPVVSTRAGGMPEVLDDGQNSLLCPVGDPGSLSTAIDRVLSDPDLALRLGRAGRESVTKGHDVVAQREQFARMYEALG
jgi:glycosyltransferase involved in cell wall biosynthesis